MKNLEYLNKIIEAKIDRPIGSSHPKYPDHIYLVNYGYIPNTVSGDGKELDCYVLGEYKPLSEFKGRQAIPSESTHTSDSMILRIWPESTLQMPRFTVPCGESVFPTL